MNDAVPRLGCEKTLNGQWRGNAKRNGKVDFVPTFSLHYTDNDDDDDESDGTLPLFSLSCPALHKN